MEYAPLLWPDEPDVAGTLTTLVRGVVSARPRPHVLTFEALDHDAPTYAPFLAALRAAGLVVAPRFHFGNWFEPTRGVSYEQYLATRPGRVRTTLRRRGRKLEKQGSVRFELLCDPSDASRAIEVYARVYAASWKKPELYPAFTPGLIRTAADAGVLRLGLLFVDDVPTAVQLWIVGATGATIYKLAHDEAYDRYSVGSLLTERMLAHVLEHDRPPEVDYGFGDDPYKKDWLASRRERWAVTAYNARTLPGAAAAARWKTARVLRGIGKRVLRRSSS